MAIIGNVEKKNWKSRILSLSIHLILLLGAVTMVYPLLIMLSGSIKSGVDFDDFTIFPEYIFNDELLYKKHLFTKFNGENVWIFNYFRLPPGALINLPVPKDPSRKQYEDFKEFLFAMRQEKPHCWRMIGMASESGVIPFVQRQYTQWLVQKFGPGHTGLTALNKAYNTDFTVWDEIRLPKENFFPRRSNTDYTSPLLQDVLEFKNTQISELHTIWLDLDSQYISNLRRKFANDLEAVNKNFGTHYNSWENVSLPPRCPKNPAFAAYWHHEIQSNINPCFIRIDRAAASHWTAFLKKRHQKDLVVLNHLYKTKVNSFSDIPMPVREPAGGQIKTDWYFFLFSAVPVKYIQVETLADQYHQWLQKRYTNLMEVNDLYCTGYKSFSEVDFPESYPHDNLRKAADWTNFLKQLNTEETGLIRSAMSEFRDFIYTRCRFDFKRVSLLFRKEIVNKNEIPFYTSFPDSPEIGSQIKEYYREYVMRSDHLTQRVISDPQRLRPEWLKFLKKQYRNDIETLNKSWGMIYSAWDQIAPPFAEYEWFNLRQNRIPIIKEYLKRNYLMVFNTILTNGFAARNTIIYCLLAVLASLLVNPLCAYALSRFKMAPAYKILLFLMLPMAFPVMVLGIPQFLLIKKMGLLNTFAALILPSMANGYMIFLLKGFFDSLPRELFESATLDGASEWTIFWNIAMSLSTPILSVLALNTFTAAYGNFMMAFLLCQDKSMWTMMVYLYQLQQTASPAVGFAALVIAAVPTLLVFIFCQNIIIKGIVVPSEK